VKAKSSGVKEHFGKAGGLRNPKRRGMSLRKGRNGKRQKHKSNKRGEARWKEGSPKQKLGEKGRH